MNPHLKTRILTALVLLITVLATAGCTAAEAAAAMGWSG